MFCLTFEFPIRPKQKRRSLFLVTGPLVAVLRGKMKRAALALAVVYAVVLSSSTLAQTQKPVEIIPLEQVHAGMRGVAYTVFQGTKPESMDVEVLGVLKNANGPKGDIILVRLGGEERGVVGLMDWWIIGWLDWWLGRLAWHFRAGAWVLGLRRWKHLELRGPGRPRRAPISLKHITDNAEY